MTNQWQDISTAQHDYRSDLQCWFGLSYSSWLTLPRVLMEGMPERWQSEMARLLFEYNDAWNFTDLGLGTRVQITSNGRLVKTPQWLINYRHPDRAQIDALRSALPAPPSDAP